MCGAGRAAPTAVLGAQSAREVRVGGVVGSGCCPRLAPALPAAPRLPPVTSAPRTITRPLERAVDAHTAGRGALSVNASASLLGWEHKCLDAAARPSTARCRSASPRMRCGYYWTGKLQECFVLQERSKQFGLLHGSSRVEGPDRFEPPVGRRWHLFPPKKPVWRDGRQCAGGEC